MTNLDNTIISVGNANTTEPKEFITSGNIRSQHTNTTNEINWNEYIYIIGEASFYSIRFKKYFTNKQIAQNLQAISGQKIKPEDVDKKLQEGVINKYFGFCYGKDEDGMFNTFNVTSVLQPSDNPDIHEGILTLIESITGGNTMDMEYIMKAILFKFMNPTSCQIPALILTGAQGTGKTSLVRLMGTILGTENVQINIGQKNLEGRFAPTKNDKLVYEYAELYSGSRTKSIGFSNMLKNTVLQEEIASERKYMDTEFVKNSAWYIITSNNPMPILLDSQDTNNRRYSVFKGTKPLQEKACLVNGAIGNKEIVANFLRYIIECFGDEVKQLETFPAHENEHKALLSNNSSSEYVDFWDELRDTEGVGTFILNKTILEKFDSYCDSNGYDTKLKINLMKSCPYTDNRTRARIGDSQPRGRFITN